MPTTLKLRRGTDTQHSSFTGAEGEVTVNTTNKSVHVHDGSTAGGIELARADLTNTSGGFDGAFSSLTGKPTTLSGYGITDSPSTLTDLGITDGTNGQVLSTDGAGNFTFEDASGGGGGGGLSSLITATDVSTLVSSPSYVNQSGVGEENDNIVVTDDYIIVGNTEYDSFSGRVWIFDKITKTLLYTIDNPNTGNVRFGYALDVSGNYLVVGTYTASGADAGKVYVYDLTTISSSLSTPHTPTYTLEYPSGGPSATWHGNQVAIDGNYIATGKTDGGSFNQPVYVYDISTFSGSTISSPNLTLPNPNSQTLYNTDIFATVKISGKYLAVGAAYEDYNTSLGYTQNVGIIYIYDISTTNTTPIHTIFNPLGTSGVNDRIGERKRLDISGTKVISSTIDSIGNVFVWDLANHTTQNILTYDYRLQSTSTEYFGQSVAISGDYIAVGSRYNSNAGRIYVYNLNTLQSNHVTDATDLIIENPGAVTYFGRTVYLNGNDLVAGRYNAYYTKLNTTPIIPQQRTSGKYLTSTSDPGVLEWADAPSGGGVSTGKAIAMSIVFG